MNKKYFFAIILILLISIFYYFQIYKAVSHKSIFNNIRKEVNIIENKFTPSPTPMPFEEFTIPYLRQRKYSSKLREMKEISANGSYKGYLTSYDSDGLRINAYLTVPQGAKPEKGWRAIVFVHGYIPPQNYSTLGNYSSYVDYLAKSGLAVFKIDLRGHGDSEGEAGGAYYSSDYVIDTLNAVSALEASDFINPKSIGLWGHSMAGNVVGRAIAVKTDIPAAVIFAGAVYSYSDFAKYSIDDNSYRPPLTQTPARRKRNEMMALYGQFDPDNFFWKLVPMTNYLKDIKGAISLNHAKDDNVVNIGYGRDLKILLDEAKITNELNEYTTGGHNFTGSTFVSAMENTVKFFDRYLK